MESGVEHKDVGLRGEHLLHRLVAFEMAGVVFGSQVHVGHPLFHHFVVDKAALSEAAARHNAVADSSNLIEAFDGAVFGMSERVEHHLHSLRVGGAVEGNLLIFAVERCF